MCASCGCGCKHKVGAKGCKCDCKMCREARGMSVEKSMLIKKAMRNFDAIYDAYLVEDEDVEKAVWNDKDPKQGLAEGATAATGAAIMGACKGKSNCRCGRHMTGRSKVGMAAGGTMMAGAFAHSINRAVKDKKENKM